MMDMRKKRKDSFFGMHFDFHAGQEQKNIGENCDPELIEKLVCDVKPDYIQCDTKGHAGATSYPTKVGYPAPEIKSDILKMWRDITARHNVALYSHHSGVWDDFALKHHPEWAAADADGKPSTQKTSVFGPYVDELLIPQLLEMANDYGLDGIWVDGECWATMPDYSEYAVKAYIERYNEQPPKPDEADYSKYLKFCREGFLKYVEHYVTEVHNGAPDFQIASNWLYSSFVPEDALINVDFISGDYSPNDSLNTARFEGRAMQHQNKPWDLMAWGFSTGEGCRCVKEYEQLCQEAAAVIMLGGGFQVYNKQCVGTVQDWAIPMWAKLAEFCRAREDICHKAESIPQIGLIYSSRAYYKDSNGLYPYYSSRHVSDLRGLLFSVLDNQFSVDILMTHHVLDEPDLNKYGVLILPDLVSIESNLKEKLIDYVSSGGNLIITGHNSIGLFLPYLDIDVIGGSEEPRAIYIEHNGKLAPIKSPYCEIKPTKAEIIGNFYFTDDTYGAAYPSASVTNYGNGKIIGIYFDVGAYKDMKTSVVRDFIGSVVRKVFTPAVEISGTKQAEVSLMTKNGKTCVNLLNLTGYHSDAKYKSFDEINKLCNIGIEIECPEKPESVYAEPEHQQLAFKYEDNKIKLTLPELHIHSVIVINSSK